MNNIESVIKKQGFYSGNIKGDSMFPLLRNSIDVVYIIKIPDNYVFKKYDVVLYRRKNNQIVLHRIIKVADNGFVICGDGENVKEYNIDKSQIIGLLTEFYRKKKHHKVTDKSVKLYSFYWCNTFYSRILKIKLINSVHRIGRKIHGGK